MLTKEGRFYKLIVAQVQYSNVTIPPLYLLLQLYNDEPVSKYDNDGLQSSDTQLMVSKVSQISGNHDHELEVRYDDKL